ncbi:MAG: WD40/YVTN/BNR-like repeat-containing protein [Gemmatimonadaceae bacterium]
MRERLLITILLGLPAPAFGQWAANVTGTDAELRGLSTAGPNVVWVSGTRGRWARTTDGGRTWRTDSVPGAAGLDFRAVHALDARRAWLMSSGDADKGQARIYRTTDAGVHWSLVYSTAQKGVFLDAIAFWDAQHGIAISDPVDGHFFVVTTNDGGTSWTRIPPARLPATLPNEAAFAASGSCLTVSGETNVWIGTGGGTTGRVYHSADRGRTWTAADTPIHAGSASSGVFSVAFRDGRRGVAVGGDYQMVRGGLPNVAITEDGGRTWRVAKGPLPVGYLSAVSFVPGSSNVVAVGLAGTAFSGDGGESWLMVDSVAYNSVRFDGTAGWAAGQKGRVAKWSGLLGLKISK